MDAVLMIVQIIPAVTLFTIASKIPGDKSLRILKPLSSSMGRTNVGLNLIKIQFT